MLLKTWFTTHTKKILTVRNKVSKEELIKELGLYANADKDKDYKKLERLIDWMIWSDFIIEDEGQISLRNENQVIIGNQKLNKYITGSKISSRIEDIKVDEKLFDQTGEVLLNSIRFNIKVTPETNIDDIREMIKKIKKAIINEKLSK